MKKVMFIFMSLLVVLSTFFFLSSGHLKPEKTIADKLSIPYLNPEILISPVNPSIYTLTSPYGPRTSPITGQYQLHGGVDLASPLLTDIYAPADGIVSFVGYEEGGAGYYMKITHDNLGLMTVYMHLPYNTQIVGNTVKKGDKIAIMGTSGSSTGSHLHFEIRKWDGSDYVRTNPVEYIPLDNKSQLPQWTYPAETEDSPELP